MSLCEHFKMRDRQKSKSKRLSPLGWRWYGHLIGKGIMSSLLQNVWICIQRKRTSITLETGYISVTLPRVYKTPDTFSFFLLLKWAIFFSLTEGIWHAISLAWNALYTPPFSLIHTSFLLVLSWNCISLWKTSLSSLSPHCKQSLPSLRSGQFLL